MGIDPAEGDIAIRFDTYDSMNVFKNLQLYVDQMGISTTADMVGAGLQSAIVIAIFRTYEEIKKEGAIFAIEEPEVYLHPQKQRYFSNILSRLGDVRRDQYRLCHVVTSSLSVCPDIIAISVPIPPFPKFRRFFFQILQNSAPLFLLVHQRAVQISRPGFVDSDRYCSICLKLCSNCLKRIVSATNNT